LRFNIGVTIVLFKCAKKKRKQGWYTLPVLLLVLKHSGWSPNTRSYLLCSMTMLCWQFAATFSFHGPFSKYVSQFPRRQQVKMLGLHELRCKQNVSNAFVLMGSNLSCFAFNRCHWRYLTPSFWQEIINTRPLHIRSNTPRTECRCRLNQNACKPFTSNEDLHSLMIVLKSPCLEVKSSNRCRTPSNSPLPNSPTVMHT
jgi:hypothetical protein